MIHGQRTAARIARCRLVRFPPGRLPGEAGPLLDVVNLVRTTGPGELLGPGTLLHAALAAAEFGAEVRGQEGDEEADFAEEGLEDGEAAAGYGEVDFDGPVGGCWVRTFVVCKGGSDEDLHPDFVFGDAPAEI